MFGSLFRFAGGAIVGATVGAAIAAVLAPKSGNQLKHDIRAYWEEVKDAGALAEAQRRFELEMQFKNARYLKLPLV